MHALLLLSSLLMVVLGGSLAPRILHRLGNPSRRRDMELLILAAPVMSLALGIGGLHHFADRTCFLGAPPWDYTMSVALPLVMGVFAFGGLALGLLRLGLMGRIMMSRGNQADTQLQSLVERLAERLGSARPRLLLCPYDRPLALTSGLVRPTILLSTWMVETLDPRELESVLAHELGHVMRRDYLVVWLATVLRDAFWYLPTSWAAHRQLQQEKEIACDQLAANGTGRPLALASALAKVWQQAIGGRTLETAQPLLGAGESIEGRIERLLAMRLSAAGKGRSHLLAFGIGASALVGLLFLEAANVAVLLAPMGCGPASFLGGLL